MEPGPHQSGERSEDRWKRADHVQPRRQTRLPRRSSLLSEYPGNKSNDTTSKPTLQQKTRWEFRNMVACPRRWQGVQSDPRPQQSGKLPQPFPGPSKPFHEPLNPRGQPPHEPRGPKAGQDAQDPPELRQKPQPHEEPRHHPRQDTLKHNRTPLIRKEAGGGVGHHRALLSRAPSDSQAFRIVPWPP